MTTPPPPPFPYTPQGQPIDRRTARAQRRAAEAQARWQQSQLRLQRRALQQRSITGPILLVATGLVLLLLQTGHLRWSSVFLWLGAWWPLLLIGAGGIMLLEWLLDTRLAQNHAAVPRRVLGGAAATLLVLLAVAGAGATALHHSFFWQPGGGSQENWLGGDWQDRLGHQFGDHGNEDWKQIFGSHSDFTETLQAPLAPDGELIIQNPRGDVVVTGSSDDGQVHVTAQQHLFSWQHDDLNSRHLREQPRLSGNARQLTLSAAMQGRDDADLTISLPHNASVTIQSEEGDVSVEEVHGAATLVARKGDVKLTAIRGPVRLTTADDDTTITAHSLDGGLAIAGHSGDIDLSDINGGLDLHGDFFGTSQFERIKGNVSFQSSFTHFTCAGIPGSVVIEGRSDLTADRLEGPVTVATSDRDISLKGLHGAATVTNRNGSITVALLSPLQPLHIANANGSVDVSLPDHQPFSLEAKTRNADIRNDFGLASQTIDSETLVKNKVLGGGPLLDLQTSEDDITLHRTGTNQAIGDTGNADRSVGRIHKPSLEQPRHETEN